MDETIRLTLITGDFIDGLRNGQGTYTYSNGDKYTGEWSNDFKSGRGEYAYRYAGAVVRASDCDFMYMSRRKEYGTTEFLRVLAVSKPTKQSPLVYSYRMKNSKCLWN